MRLPPELVFVVGLAFVSAGAFAFATWTGLLTLGVAFCVVAWGMEARDPNKPPGDGKGSPQ